MAFVVRRPKGRFEIRESVATAKGPRARTLAAFTELTDGVLRRASEAAHTAFDPAKITRDARRAGARVRASEVDEAAARLLRRLVLGDALSPRFATALQAALDGEPLSEADEWIGATTKERGDALRDLLGLADATCKTAPEHELTFPGLSPRLLTSRRQA